MKKSYRLVIMFVFVFAVAAGIIQARIEKNRIEADVRLRLQSLGLGMEDSVTQLLEQNRAARLVGLLRKFSRTERDSIALVCSDGKPTAMGSTGKAYQSVCSSPVVASVEAVGAPQQETTIKLDGDRYLVHIRRIEPSAATVRSASLVLLHSLARLNTPVQYAFFRAFLTALVAGTIGFLLYELLTRWILRQSLRVLVRWTRNAFRSEPSASSARIRELDRRLPEEFRELTKELSSLALKMRQERLRLVWNSEAAVQGVPQEEADRGAKLRAKVNEVLHGRQLIIVANREPYSHVRKEAETGESAIQVVRPASGVVTALEPIMRLTGGGIWVGHASGNADGEVVDRNGEVRVPPEHPTYTLRRVWLSREEENGYYYGFSNEGLWPLCHLAYTRPVFRLSDWEMYKHVNQKFAETTLRGVNTSNAVILVQDYHYALLPKMLRDRASDAAIELFWHIPWPNPEAFGICPQYKELLEGMLGADVIGFHTQFHCNNFLETCDRYLEARVDWERFSVTIGNHETLVRSYPISIATEPVPPLTPQRREELKVKYGIRAEHVALGVDRLDYTKGLTERISGVERFLEKYPEYIGKFTFVEMGTPSRVHIPSYRHLIEEFEGAIDRVNKRFGNGEYKPVILLKGHYDWSEVSEFYQLGQVCLVTSLHDGMNLVAKEYVWAQASDQGALILSRFTGAARELSEAVIVNPYSTEEIADALYETLNWTPQERAERMRRMKEKVRKHNAFHWATDLLAGVTAKA